MCLRPFTPFKLQSRRSYKESNIKHTAYLLHPLAGFISAEQNLEITTDHIKNNRSWNFTLVQRNKGHPCMYKELSILQHTWGKRSALISLTITSQWRAEPLLWFNPRLQVAQLLSPPSCPHSGENWKENVNLVGWVKNYIIMGIK